MEAYDAYQRDIHGFLRAATRDPDVAEDLTQETFIRLFREIQAGRTPENIRAWLYTVATNLVTSRGRRMAVAERFKAVLAIRGSADSPEQETVRAERQDIVQRALAKLPTDDRTALLLSAHGFAGREIAAVLGRYGWRDPDAADARPASASGSVSWSSTRTWAGSCERAPALYRAGRGVHRFPAVPRRAARLADPPRRSATAAA